MHISGAGNGRDRGVSNDPTWRIFRIMSEFVDGFQFLSDVHHSVTIFGSARLPLTDPLYEQARRLGGMLARQGYTVVTGGGPGIMQAGNQGAFEAGGRSVGLNIELPHEQRTNPYVKQSKSFHYFFSRKVMLDFSADAFVFFPGGFGTLDEFFELVTLRQTGKLHNAVPIVLIGSDYWAPLCAWMRQALLERFRAIAPEDLTIWSLTDDLDEALRLIDAGVRQVRQHRKEATGSERHTADEKLSQATQPMAGTEQ
ncbi:MAG TPA: TIGR00730 family Rossman fold protein [Ktedonobacterales bacterium]|nr:TIGR00730 family Rossman fold protein [Ktedonobacterales bacterium]